MFLFDFVVQKFTDFNRQTIKWQSNNGKVITVNFLDQAAANALNSITTSFIERLARVDIALNLCIVCFSKRHSSRLRELHKLIFIFQHDASVHNVSLSYQLAQHLERNFVFLWFAVNFSIQRNNSVACDD